MGHFRWIVIIAAVLCSASAVLAHPKTKKVGGYTIHTITRVVDGIQRQETYLLRNRSKHRRYNEHTGRRYYPRCRTGLFGRIVNKPCLVRHRYGQPRRGKPY